MPAIRPNRVAAAFLALVLALLAAGVAPPPARAADAPAAAVDGSVTMSYRVPTRDGILYLEVVHPTAGGTVVPAPAILTYSPYSVLGRNGDADRWVPRGYARMYADVVGTGNSGGCYDYGGLREQRTAYDLVEWVAAQPWSTGKVGMIGGSYDGTTQYAAAVTHPPHLTTIIPQVAISRWYGYAYSGGIRYTLTNEEFGNEGPGASTDEGLDTPLAFDFGLALPPPVDVTDPTWAQRVASKVMPCDELSHTTHGYDDTPDYDTFWQERDYVSRLSTVHIPVLVSGNWGDWNVKQEEGIHAYRALLAGGNTAARLFEGTRWKGHGLPPDTTSTSYTHVVDDWMAHFLLGADNHVLDRLPAVTTQQSDSAGPLAYSAGPPATHPLQLFAAGPVGTSGQLTPQRPGAETSPASFTITGTNTETRAAAQYRLGAGYLAFETAPLDHDVRIFGSPQVRLRAQTGRSFVTLTPSLLDVDPATYVDAGAATTSTQGVVGVTRAWQDTRYSADGRSAGVTTTPGSPFDTTLVAKPTDYTFRAGHRIVLVVQTETAEWTVVKPPPPCLGADCDTLRVSYADGATSLVLPVVAEDAAVPGDVVPEAPASVMLPLVAAALLGGLAWRQRRRRFRRAV